MTRRKTKKLSKVTPTRASPVQPGTMEISAPGIFGARIAVIRSNAEAAKAVPQGVELRKMLATVYNDPGLPPHGTGNLEISLARNRAIQERLVLKAQAAAEHVWPGFNEMMQVLVDRENEYVAALATMGVGVA